MFRLDFVQFECFLFFIVANIINIKYIFYTLLFVDWGKKENEEKMYLL